MPVPRASRSLWASVLALACAGPLCSEAVGPFLAPVRLEQQQPPLKFCPGNATGAKGNASCLANEQCCVHEYYGASGCEVTTAAGTKTCCAPGPARATSTTMPNVLVIGDSVSNQYGPFSPPCRTPPRHRNSRCAVCCVCVRVCLPHSRLRDARRRGS